MGYFFVGECIFTYFFLVFVAGLGCFSGLVGFSSVWFGWGLGSCAGVWRLG